MMIPGSFVDDVVDDDNDFLWMGVVFVDVVDVAGVDGGGSGILVRIPQWRDHHLDGRFDYF